MDRRISLNARQRVAILELALALAFACLVWAVIAHRNSVASRERTNTHRTCVNTSQNPDPLARCVR